jgi:hypothetical protein
MDGHHDAGRIPGGDGMIGTRFVRAVGLANDYGALVDVFRARLREYRPAAELKRTVEEIATLQDPESPLPMQ